MKKLSNKSGYTILVIILITTTIIFFYMVQTYRFYDLTALKKAVVIKPVFTSSAYQDNGFYSYYRGECNESCLTVKIIQADRFESSNNALEIFKVNGVDIISDIDVHNNPSILIQYKTVIMLHNEYVTQEEFDAVTSHPYVIYLYPNALYAKVQYHDGTITLERGHNFPEITVSNGFDWKYDNSPLEREIKCKDWKFYAIGNGYMLNCNPEIIIKRNPEILLKLIELVK